MNPLVQRHAKYKYQLAVTLRAAAHIQQVDYVRARSCLLQNVDFAHSCNYILPTFPYVFAARKMQLVFGRAKLEEEKLPPGKPSAPTHTKQKRERVAILFYCLSCVCVDGLVW